MMVTLMWISLHLVVLIKKHSVANNSIWWNFSTVMVSKWVREREGKVLSSVYFNKTPLSNFKLWKWVTRKKKRGKPGTKAKSSKCLRHPFTFMPLFFSFTFLKVKVSLTPSLLRPHRKFPIVRIPIEVTGFCPWKFGEQQ